MKLRYLLLCALPLLLSACGAGEAEGFLQITQQEAMRKMQEPGVILLDVREEHEFAESHIPGAVLLPLGSIDEQTAAVVIPQKDSTVLVYCRSGRRSVEAARKLVELGYTGVQEFGGIITWPYDVVS